MFQVENKPSDMICSLLPQSPTSKFNPDMADMNSFWKGKEKEQKEIEYMLQLSKSVKTFKKKCAQK